MDLRIVLSVLKVVDQLINQVLHERYQVQSLLGRKTGRRTFLACDLQTGSIVVLKLLLFAPDFTWEDLKLFEREAETLKSVDHPAIPKYLDYFEANTELGKGFALVQSYIEARSLQQWVQTGRTFSELELKYIAKQLLEILDYLHDRKPPIVHRDIKPSNILLGDRSGNSPGQVYLVDFGSEQTAAHDGTITVVGTYGYMPPEQFGGRSLPASDLFSLGATLIYLATGQHPADLPQDDLRIEFEKFVTLSQLFNNWIRNLTEPSLSKRPESARKAMHRLQGAIEQDELQSSSTLQLICCPDSKIQIQADSTILKIEVPPKQARIPFQSDIVLINQFFEKHSWLQPPLLVFFLFLPLEIKRILILLLGIFYACRFIVRAVSSSRVNRIRVERHHIKFELEGDVVFVSIDLDYSKQAPIISRQKLLLVSAEPDKIRSYRLNFDCQSPNGAQYSFHITGDRAEIRWVCDTLSEWGSFTIDFREPADDSW